MTRTWGKAGRRRWKSETDNHHPLNTKGYPAEHHYGHGQQPLAWLLASRSRLACLVQTVVEWLDDQDHLLRPKLPSRQRLFGAIRTLASSLCFQSWGDWMTFMLPSFEPAPTPLETG